MKTRAAIAAAALVTGLLVTSAAQAEPYVGSTRTAGASVYVRGSDGVLYRFAVDLQATGWPSIAPERRQVRVALFRCARAGQCQPVGTSVQDVTQRYKEAFDTSITAFEARFGGVSMVVQWDAPPGFGWGPTPAADASRAEVSTSSPARAVLVLFTKSWYVRCFDQSAKVGMRVGAATIQPWVAPRAMRLPAGLAGPIGYRDPVCHQ